MIQRTASARRAAKVRENQPGYDRLRELARSAERLASGVPQIPAEIAAQLAAGRRLDRGQRRRNARAIRRGGAELRRRHFVEMGLARVAANGVPLAPRGSRGPAARQARRRPPAESPGRLLARVARALFYLPRVDREQGNDR